MASTYTAPGVYPEVTDLSQIIQNAETSVLAIVGEAERGPINKPTLVTSFTKYKTLFGEPNLKYGYMGATMAAAFETAGSGYVVRVCGTGYKYGYVLVNEESQGSTWTPGSGYTEAQYKADKFASDTVNALSIAAADPNKLSIKVEITESTEIPPNNAPTSVSGVVATKAVTVTAYDHGLAVGDFVLITGASDAAYNGKFLVTGTTTTTFTYTATNTPTVTNPTGLRYVKYPSNKDRLFDLTVYVGDEEGTYTAKETYQGLTLFDHKNSMNQQTNIASVINGTSSLITVFVNEDLAYDEANNKYGFPAVGSGLISGGNLGSAVTSSDIAAGWDLFKNPDEIQVNLLLNAGYISKEDTVVAKKLASIADSRRDCFFLVDTPYNCTDPDKAVDFRKNSLRLDTWRGAITGQWVKVTDTFSGNKDVLIPGSAWQAQVICRNDQVSVFKAPAGPKRGIIDSGYLPVTGLSYEYDKGEQGVVYKNGVNYFKANSVGAYMLFGQKTLQSAASALDRIKTARTVITIETALTVAAAQNLFENNTPFLRAQITEVFNDYLENIRAQGGLTDFKVVCDDTNNTAQTIDNEELHIDVYLKPTHTVEFIRLQSVITGSDADFNVLIATGGNF